MQRLLPPAVRPTIEPRRIHDWEDSRHATWLELFYDPGVRRGRRPPGGAAPPRPRRGRHRHLRRPVRPRVVGLDQLLLLRRPVRRGPHARPPGLWLLSIAVPAPGRYWLWGAAVVANALLSGPIAYARVSSAPHQVSHMPERFGLFALVVLGESMLGVVNGIEATDWRAASVVTAVAGFVIAASIWWVYFGAFDEAAIDRAIAGGRYAQLRSFVYGYGHLVVYAAVAATGVGVELSVEAAADGGEPVALLAIALTGVMLGFTLMAGGVGSQGPRRIVAAKATAIVVGILAALLLDDVAVATAGTAAAWAVLAAVKSSVVRESASAPAAAPP